VKQISKDPSQDRLEDLNDATNIKIFINKTTELEINTDNLKRISNDKPNNQIKLSNVAATLMPDQIKCNILKGNNIDKGV
jgi:hypothetical protein